MLPIWSTPVHTWHSSLPIHFAVNLFSNNTYVIVLFVFISTHSFCRQFVLYSTYSLCCQFALLMYIYLAVISISVRCLLIYGCAFPYSSLCTHTWLCFISLVFNCIWSWASISLGPVHICGWSFCICCLSTYIRLCSLRIHFWLSSPCILLFLWWFHFDQHACSSSYALPLMIPFLLIHVPLNIIFTRMNWFELLIGLVYASTATNQLSIFFPIIEEKDRYTSYSELRISFLFGWTSFKWSPPEVHREEVIFRHLPFQPKLRNKKIKKKHKK